MKALTAAQQSSMMKEENNPDAPKANPASHGETVDATPDPIPASWITLAMNFLQGLEELDDDTAEEQLQNLLPTSDAVDDREYQMSFHSVTIPSDNQTPVFHPRRIPYENGWFSSLLSTGRARLDEYCDPTTHNHVSLHFIHDQLQQLLNAQAQHPQKALRLSNDLVTFSVAAIPEIVLILHCPLPFFCRKNNPSKRKTVTSLFKFFCQLVTHPTDELSRAISNDRCDFSSTDNVMQMANKLNLRHTSQLNTIDSLIAIQTQHLSQSVTIQTLVMILQNLIEIRQAITYECLLALSLAHLTANQTCSHQILSYIQKEFSRCFVYARLYYLKSSLNEYFSKYYRTYKILTQNYVLLQRSVQNEIFIRKFAGSFKSSLITAVNTDDPKNSSQENLAFCYDSNHPESNRNLIMFSECLRMLKQLPSNIPSKELRLRKFLKLLHLIYNKVLKCDFTLKQIHHIYQSLYKRLNEELVDALKNQKQTRYNSSYRCTETSLKYLYQVFSLLQTESQNRLFTILDSFKAQATRGVRRKSQESQPPDTCIFCKATNHPSISCPSTDHPFHKRNILKDAHCCLKCFQKKQAGHSCFQTCILCGQDDHHKIVCMTKVPPLNIKKRCPPPHTKHSRKSKGK